MTNAALARPPRAPQPAKQPPRDFLAEVTNRGSGLPSRVILHGVEGVGKTSWASQAPFVIFGQSLGETGLETLIDSGQVTATPHFPQWESWDEVLASVNQLIDQEHAYRTFAVDTLNGVERLCHEHVCRRDFNGDWTDRGFMGYMRGYEVALSEWRLFLALLDRLRSEKKMAVVCLVHTKISRFSNPEGADFDRFAADLHHKTWAVTHRWADMVLFATFFVDTVKDGQKHKGVGGQERILYTEHTAAYDAKNRHGLTESIAFGPDTAGAWANFAAALKDAKSGAVA